MSGFAYARLTGLDRSFLIYESPSSPMHVGAVQIYEAGPLRGADGSIDIERIQAWVESRLHRIPRYRQRVVSAPFDGHPIWVDDARFNLRYHVRHSRLPRPGTDRILKRTCARLLEQRLDLSKPPWELWVVEGLENDRVAVVSKTHHCMIDGSSGVDVMTLLMAAEPTGEVEPPPVWVPLRAPSAFEYARGEIARRAGAPFRLAETMRRVVTDEGGARGELSERAQALWRVVAKSVSGATRVPFNQPIGPHRRFDWLSMSLESVRTVRDRFGGTVNDVVLTVVAGALRVYLHRVRQIDVDGLDFKVMVPVNVRAAEERGHLGNRVAAWLLSLPLAERDSVRRLALVRDETRRLAQRHEALGLETMTQALEWLGSTPISLGARLARSSAPFNMVVTNVPGPRDPQYLLGARMLDAYPVVPLMGTLGLGVALFSYAGTLYWGFTADWDLVPDLHELVLSVDREFERLLARARDSSPASC
jgi:WS/DGAT/MGAT family acyltransferase